MNRICDAAYDLPIFILQWLVLLFGLACRVIIGVYLIDIRLKQIRLHSFTLINLHCHLHFPLQDARKGKTIFRLHDLFSHAKKEILLSMSWLRALTNQQFHFPSREKLRFLATIFSFSCYNSEKLSFEGTLLLGIEYISNWVTTVYVEKLIRYI